MFVPSPANRILRRVGYGRDKRGFLNRYFRESEEWQEHLDNCKQFILTCLKNKDIRELVVLGSGWLLDFPLEILAGEIQQIKLVDIKHPPQVLKKIRKYPGVECIAADITAGYVEKIYRDARRCRKNKIPFILDRLPAPELKMSREGFVISLNILSQLDSIITDYLKELINPGEEKIIEISAKLQTDHIGMLMNTRFVLIYDYEEIITGPDGQDRESRKDIHAIIPPLPYTKEWFWKFDSQGTYNPGRKTIFRVRALCSEMPEIQ